jgi:extracellular factor (EF) 3-hydroxypalmitic acid methyl ester biosynthesis protein
VDERDVVAATQQFTGVLKDVERQLRRQPLSPPPQKAKELVAQAFWALFAVSEEFASQHQDVDLTALKRNFRGTLMPWLCRSRYFWRSMMKPHGYSGDFRMMEWMYDLEGDDFADLTQPALVNCLDYTFSTIHSVQSVWERRRWLAGHLRREFERAGALAVLDVGCGGARYVRDFLSQTESSGATRIVLVDQDPAAIAYARDQALAPWPWQVAAFPAPVKRLPSFISGEFDVVISSGLFDYLNEAEARSTIACLLAVLKPGGLLAITNFHSEDRSAHCKDWGADWQLVLRDEEAMGALFPAGVEVELGRSANGSLLFASVRC